MAVALKNATRYRSLNLLYKLCPVCILLNATALFVMKKEKLL